MSSPHVPVVVFSCAQCGSGAFSTPSDRDDAFIVTCKSCGATIGTAKEIEGAAKNALAAFDIEPSSDDVREAFRKAFKNLKTIRVE